MSSFVNICSKLDPNSGHKLNKLLINDLKTDVKTLRQLVSKQLNLTEDKFDLMCFGLILTSDQTLDGYGITNGTTVWVLNKNNFDDNSGDGSNTDSMASRVKASPEEIVKMVYALRTALMETSFRQMLDKLCDSEDRENLMAVTPGLREDPTVFAILRDPDLLTTLTKPTNICKVLARHPCLLDAATNLSATFHEETIANKSSGGPSGRGSTTFSYSLNAMYDDDDEGTADTMTQRIAEAISRSYPSHRFSGTQSTASGVITQDMLAQALQQWTAPVTLASTSTGVDPNTSTASTPFLLPSFDPLLQQLRQLGSNDNMVAIEALEPTDGDVEEAIEIIYSDNN